MSSRENPSSASAAWTYRMEVSPTGQNPAASIANPNDPILLLHLLANLQNQTLEIQRQQLEFQRQQLEISRELLQVNREQRARQGAELEALAGGPRACPGILPRYTRPARTGSCLVDGRAGHLRGRQP